MLLDTVYLQWQTDSLECVLWSFEWYRMQSPLTAHNRLTHNSKARHISTLNITGTTQDRAIHVVTVQRQYERDLNAYAIHRMVRFSLTLSDP